MTQNLPKVSGIPSSATPRRLSIPLSSLPTNALDARSILQKIQKVHGFQYFLENFLTQNGHIPLINRHSLPITSVEWPVLIPNAEFIQLLDQCTMAHTTECTRLSFDAVSSIRNTIRIPKPSTSNAACPTCSSNDRVIYAITTFIGAAYLNNYPVESLRRVWELTDRRDWVSRYVMKRDQAVVNIGAQFVLQCVEREAGKELSSRF